MVPPGGVITERHLDWMGKVTLASGLGVAYTYLLEIFIAWYSAEPAEWAQQLWRMTGPYAPYYWAMMLINVVLLQTLWFPRFRRNVAWLFVFSILANVGMWLERFVIVVISLSHDFLPGNFHLYSPTWVDWTLFLGTLGFFLFGLAVLIRLFPPSPWRRCCTSTTSLGSTREAPCCTGTWPTLTRRRSFLRP